MNNIVLIQSSLNPNSKTAILVKATAKYLEQHSIAYEIIDLRDLELQFCDGRRLQEYNSDMQQAHDTIKAAQAVIIGMPVYSYSISGPLKNFLDIAGRGLQGKFVGILCQSGGYRSYLASADLVKIISFEFFGFAVQPIVHTTYNEFSDNQLTDPGAINLIQDMLQALKKVLAPTGEVTPKKVNLESMVTDL